MIPAGRGGAVALVFAVALAARLGYVLAVGSSAIGLSADARGYHDLAVNLLIRHEFVTAMDPPHRLDLPYATRPPLTPFVLAGLYWLTGPSWTAAQALLSVTGALGCALVTLLGHRLFGPATGLVAGLLAALDPFLVFLPSVPLTENLALPLYAALALLLVRLGDGGGRGAAAATGLGLGLAALNKPTILGVVPFLAVWLGLRFRGRLGHAGVTLAVVVTVAALVLAPWTLRNGRALGGFVPVTTQGGSTLYDSNGPHAEYSIRRLEEGAQGWYYGPGAGGPTAGLPAPEADRVRTRLALQFIASHPGTFLDQARRKVRIFWGVYASPIHALSWSVLGTLAAVGVGLAWRAWRRLVPVYLLILQTALIPVFFTSMPRFRAPIEPLLLVFAAVSLVALARRASGRAPAPLDPARC